MANEMKQAGSQDVKLRRELKPIHVWAIAFGCIIGWGSFINPGKKFLPASGVSGTAIAMTLGALIMIIIAFSYAYMVPKYPKAGGEFTFTKACFGKRAAYLCGWFLVAAYLTNVPMNSTALFLIMDGLFGPVLKFGFHYQIAGFDIYMGEMLFAMAILAIFAYLNIRGVKVAGIVQTILAITLAVCVFTLMFAAIASPVATVSNMEPMWGFDKSTAIADAAAGTYSGVDAYANSSVATAILATLAIAPWAFVGFDTIPQAAEEFKFSPKKVSFIMIVAILFGAIVYISNNTITAAALEQWPDLIVYADSTPWLLLAAAEKMLGTFGKVLVGAGVFSAVLTGMMGFYMASSRLMFSMARDGYLPKVFAQVDKKHGTPKNAMIFCFVISLSGPILGREALGWFVDMSAIGASIGFGFTCMSTLVTMKRFGDGSTFLKVMAVLGAAFSLMFIVLQLVPIPGLSGVHFCTESYIMLVVWILIGLAFYLYQRKSFLAENAE